MNILENPYNLCTRFRKINLRHRKLVVDTHVSAEMSNVT